MNHIQSLEAEAKQLYIQMVNIQIVIENSKDLLHGDTLSTMQADFFAKENELDKVRAKIKQYHHKRTFIHIV